MGVDPCVRGACARAGVVRAPPARADRRPGRGAYGGSWPGDVGPRPLLPRLPSNAFARRGAGRREWADVGPCLVVDASVVRCIGCSTPCRPAPSDWATPRAARPVAAGALSQPERPWGVREGPLSVTAEGRRGGIRAEPASGWHPGLPLLGIVVQADQSCSETCQGRLPELARAPLRRPRSCRIPTTRGQSLSRDPAR